MKTPFATAFLNQLVVCLLVTFGFAGTSGVYIVWQRHENARLANANRIAEARLVALDRKISQTITKVEGEKSSDVLQRRIREWNLGLAAASEQQVQRILEDPVRRLARQRARELFGEGVPAVTIRLASNN